MTREEWKNHVTMDHIEEVRYYVECLLTDYGDEDDITDLSYEALDDINYYINLFFHDLEKIIMRA